MTDGLHFCTKEELHELTGYKQHDKQAEWLADNRYEFDRRASDGRPNVLREQVRQRQLGKKPGAKRKPGPDFSWLQGAA